MDEYKRIQKQYKRYIIPIKIISFSFCLLILSQDILLSFKHYYDNPFTVVTKLIELNLVETPTLSICIAHQLDMNKFKLDHGKLYNETIKYYEDDYKIFRKIIFEKLTIQQHLDMATKFEELGICKVLMPNGNSEFCNITRDYTISLTPFRLCYSFFERKFSNTSQYVYKRIILEKRSWISLRIDKKKMRRKWIDIALGTVPKATLVYHGYPGFISLSTNYYKHIKIGIDFFSIKKLKYPYETDCIDYVDDNEGCYSRETCIEVCYAEMSLEKFIRWPKNLQTWEGPANLNETYFSMDESGVEALRAICGAKFEKPDCLTLSYEARVIDEEMIKPNEYFGEFQLNIYASYKYENKIVYTPTYDSSQLYYEICQSVASFLGFCIFDIYKLLIYLYDLVHLD